MQPEMTSLHDSSFLLLIKNFDNQNKMVDKIWKVSYTLKSK